ncbi:MAG: helix-turn-helix domain-containing protein [Clostridiales bacterium]|nr:helix-turn-helix domain-containing protein [Clostridiales bacterium]
MLANTILEMLKTNYGLNIEEYFSGDDELLSFRVYQEGMAPDRRTLYLCREVYGKLMDAGYYCLLYNLKAASTQENTVSVYTIGGSGGWEQVVNALQDIWDNNAKIARYFQPLYRLACQGLDINAFLEKVRDMVQNDLMIISSTFEIVGATLPNDSQRSFFVERNGHTYLSPQSIQYIKSDAHFRNMVAGRIAFFTGDTFFAYPAIICGVLTGEQFVGYLCLLQTTTAFTREDYPLVSYLSELAAQLVYTLPLQNNLFAYNVSDDYFLHHLLSRDGQNIERLASLFGLERHLKFSRYQVLVCSCPEEKKKQAHFHFYHQLQQILPGYPIMQVANTCVLLLYGNERGIFTPFSKQILTDLLTLQRQNAVLSLEYTDIGQTAFYYKYALRLLELSLGRQGQVIQTMEQEYLTFLREAYVQKEDPALLVHPDLRELEQIDQRSGSELARTLSVYLTCNRNVAEMAKALHISKSAGFYRINQIKDLLGDPFSGRTRMFCYECAERLMEPE